MNFYIVHFQHSFELLTYPSFVQTFQNIIGWKTMKFLGVILDRIVGSNDPETLVNQASDLSSSEETIFFLGYLFLHTDLFLEAGIMDDSVQC